FDTFDTDVSARRSGERRTEMDRYAAVSCHQPMHVRPAAQIETIRDGSSEKSGESSLPLEVVRGTRKRRPQRLQLIRWKRKTQRRIRIACHQTRQSGFTPFDVHGSLGSYARSL